MKKETQRHPYISRDELEKKYYRLLTEKSHDIILTQDVRGRILYVNPAWTETTGYSAEDTQGKRLREFISAEYQLVYRQYKTRENLQDENLRACELEIVGKTGEKIPLEIRSWSIFTEKGELQEVLLVGRDIRARKKSEKALIESEKHYRSLFEDAPIPLWEEDFSALKEYLNSLKEKGVEDFATYFDDHPSEVVHCASLVKIVNVNQAALKLYKASSKEKLLRKFLEIFGEEALQTFKQELLSLLQGQTSFKAESITYTLKKEKIYHIIEWQVLQGYEDSWKKIIVSTQDIGDLRETQASLGASESSYRDLFNSIDDAIYIQDKKGRFLDVNTGAEKLYGYSREEFIGKTPAHLSAPGKNNLDEIAKKIQRAFRGEPQDFEFWGQKANGEIFPKEVHIYKGNYFGDDVVIALARDISEQKNAEAALKRQLNELNILQATAFTCTQAAGQDALIRQITNIIGNTLYPDNFGILFLDEKGEFLLPHPSYQGIEKEKLNERHSTKSGIVGQVAATGKSIRLADVRQSDVYKAVVPSTRSELCVPIKTGEKLLAVINAESTKTAFFTENDERLLNTIAGQIATSLEKIRLFETEKKRRKIAEKLQKSAAILTTTLSQDKAIELILKELSAVVSFDSASLQLLEENHLRIVGGRGVLVLEKERNRTFPYPDDNPNTVVMQTKKPLILEDAQSAYPLFKEMPSVKSWLGVPLIVHERAIGILTLDSSEVKHFSEDDARLVTSFANHAAIAVENANLFKAEKNRRQEAETLRRSAQAISSSLNLDEVLKTILESIRQTIPYDSAAIMLLEGDRLKLSKGYGIPHLEKHIGSTYSKDDPLSQEIIKDPKPLLIQDAREVAHFKGWADTNYVRGWMGVPLIVRGKSIGYITLDSRQVGAYTKKDAELAQTFAHQAASAIENARLYQAATRTAERRAVLHRLTQDILRGIQSPDTTYQAIHHAAEELMDCDVFILSLRDPDKDFDEAVYLVDQGKRYNAQKTPKEKSIVALVEKEKGSLIRENISNTDFQLEETCFCSKEKIRSLLISPMYVGHELVGVISTQSYRTNAYGNEEKILLEMLASYAAAAIENARLFSETERRGKEFSELYRLTQDLIAPQEKVNLLKTTLERAVHLLGVSSGDVYIYHRETEKLEVVASYGLPKSYIEQVKDVCIDKNEGVAGYVARSLKPLRVDDYQVWEGKSPKYDAVPFTSILEVPMIYAGNLVGILALYELYPRTRYFTKDDERIMTLFATQVAGALHSAKQFEQINNRLLEVEAVNRVSIALRSAETLEEMYPILIDEVCRSLNIQVASFWLSEPNTKEISRVVARGWVKNIQPDKQADDIGIIGHIYKSGEYRIVSNMRDDNPYLYIVGDTEPLENWAGAWVPVRSTDSIIGVLEVLAEVPRKFNENDIRQLTTLAEIFGNAIHRARLYKRSKKQIKRLTTLRNIDSAISANFDLRITLELLVNHAVKQLGADAANILLLSSEDEKLKYFVGKGFNTTLFYKTNLKISEGMPGKAVQEQRMQSAALPYDEVVCPREKWLLEEKFASYHCTPLTAKGKPLGVLEIFHRKPFIPTLDWQDFLQTLAGQATIAIDNNQLFEDLKRSNQELAFAYDTTLEGWGKALELRDRETQGHTLNVTELTLKLARRIGIDEAQLVHVYRGALLHDIGKMGIPDNILRKPGPLTKKEWEIMRQHPQFAHDMIAPIPYLHPALDIPYCHHERWDGKGYPRGLKGEEIPLAARIFSIIDVWDALRTDRPYREAWDKKTIINYIRNESGTRFDPKIVEVFLDMIQEN